MPGLKQFAVIFEPFFFLWRCHSASNDHPQSFSTSNQFREKENAAETRNSEELKKKLRPMPRHKRRASLSSEPGCEKNIDEDSQIPHDGTPWMNPWIDEMFDECDMEDFELKHVRKDNKDNKSLKRWYMEEKNKTCSSCVRFLNPTDDFVLRASWASVLQCEEHVTELGIFQVSTCQ